MCICVFPMHFYCDHPPNPTNRCLFSEHRLCGWGFLTFMHLQIPHCLLEGQDGVQTGIFVMGILLHRRMWLDVLNSFSQLFRRLFTTTTTPNTCYHCTMCLLRRVFLVPFCSSYSIGILTGALFFCCYSHGYYFVMGIPTFLYILVHTFFLFPRFIPTWTLYSTNHYSHTYKRCIVLF